jgi:hypothetical protein
MPIVCIPNEPLRISCQELLHRDPILPETDPNIPVATLEKIARQGYLSQILICLCTFSYVLPSLYLGSEGDSGWNQHPQLQDLLIPHRIPILALRLYH